jgi:hypothetical protein
MKKKLLNFCIPLALGLGFTANAQRYCSEIFSDSQIQVTSDVTFDNNVDFLRSDFSDQTAVVTDITAIKTALAMGNPIPLKYFLTNDANTPVGDSTSVKVTPVKMDIYEPMQSIDNVTDRPVIVYVHTGNFIPPPFNGLQLSYVNNGPNAVLLWFRLHIEVDGTQFHQTLQ